jgi:signal peptide peptidase SppA
MAHQLFRLTQKLCNKPQLISLGALSSVLAYLQTRNSQSVDMAIDTEKRTSHREPIINADYNVGLIQIEGALTNIHYVGACGEEGVSYESIIHDTNKLIEAGVSTIVLDIDSGGGEAYGCFESAKVVRQLADENNVRILAYVDGMAASAAYAWASIADEIIVNPMAEVGSIGVVVHLMNYLKMYESMGLESTFIYAGDSKIPYDKEMNFSEVFLADLQQSVYVFYESFVSLVAENRKLSVEQVKSTQAKVFLPEQALALGLADKVMTKQEFIKYAFI